MHEVIGQIIRLSDGYVLQIHGKSYAARSAQDLAKIVQKRAPQHLRKSQPQLNVPAAVPVPAPKQEPPSPEVLRETEMRNLDKLITARLNNLISGEDLMRGALEYCPGMEPEEIAQLVQAAEAQFFQMSKPDPSRGLGPKCACAQCTQVVSYVNPAGQCVNCFRGEHLHPPDGWVPGGNNGNATPTLPAREGGRPLVRAGADAREAGEPTREGAGDARGDDETGSGTEADITGTGDGHHDAGGYWAAHPSGVDGSGDSSGAEQAHPGHAGSGGAA